MNAKEHLDLSNSVLNTIPDIVFYKDSDGVYLGGNKAWLDLIGKSDREDFVGKTDFDLFPEDVARGFRAMDSLMLREHRTTRNDEKVVYPDGRHVLLETVKTPLTDGQGKVIGILGISRDITAREATDQDGVAAATEAWYAALNAMFEGNGQPMKDAWSHAQDVTYMGPAGDYVVGWSAIEEVWDAQTAQKLGGHVTPKRVNTIVSRDMALINCIETGQNEIGGKTEVVEIRSSTTFRLEDGRWKAIAHQTDMLAYVKGSE